MELELGPLISGIFSNSSQDPARNTLVEAYPQKVREVGSFFHHRLLQLNPLIRIRSLLTHQLPSCSCSVDSLFAQKIPTFFYRRPSLQVEQARRFEKHRRSNQLLNHAKLANCSVILYDFIMYLLSFFLNKKLGRTDKNWMEYFFCCI